ncbi:unnamed protein product [Rotaria sp. Silwood1]|nr:unnamed protein product [Rotaria sp. Silwood1]
MIERLPDYVTSKVHFITEYPCSIEKYGLPTLNSYAKHSLKLNKDQNFKTLHLGFIEQFIQEAIEDHKQILLDYLNSKLLIENKINYMKKWRKQDGTTKNLIENLQEIIDKKVLMIEIPAILYQIRYLLRAFFENKKDKKLF